MNALGSLDKEVPLSCDEVYDTSSSNAKSRKLLKASVEGRTYPNYINYTYMQGDALNQNPDGICYITTACNFAKFIVWLHTGKKLTISHGEAKDVAGDGKSMSSSERKGSATDGGYHHDSKGLLRFNLPEWQAQHMHSSGENECLRLFKQICDAAGINENNVYLDASIGSSKANCIKYLNQHGPFYWGHHCCFYHPRAQYGQDNHAILGVGYDKDGVFMKGSWSDDSSYELVSYEHYFHVSWADFEQYGNMIGPYNINFWKNL